jgi:biotin transport system ATP-binding protein
MLEVSNLSRRFPGQTLNALSGVSFSVREKDCIVISGANGSGKSVLMHMIAGLDRPTSGKVTLARIEGKQVRVGLVFQDADAQILGDTPEEDVCFGPKNLGFDKKKALEIAGRVLKQTGLEGKEKMPARSLSGGEKRRLAVAGVLAMDARLIIFDEPFANLDWPGVLQVNEILVSLKKEGKTIIILTHELEKVLALANRLLILLHGQLVFDGTPEEGIGSGKLEEWGIRNPLGSYSKTEDLLWTQKNSQ